MLERVKEIIAEQLNVDASEITEESSFKDDLGADSLYLCELVMACANENENAMQAVNLAKITILRMLII